MTVELITGFAGTPHIGSDDIGAFQAGIVGPGDYALATGNQLRATMSNANTIAVQSGDAVLNGRHVHLTGTTTATVQSGTQGQKRNDLVVLRYTKNTTTGVETCSIVVLKGTPTTGTPADPAHNTGSILDGVATHDMPLYRIPLAGITVGTLVPLFNVLKPMKDVWDSLTPLPTSVQSGVFIGSSNENGICVISYQSPNGKAPDVIVATPGPWPSDDMRGLAITIWENGVNAAQMRLMNTRTGEFGTRWPARFSWVAIWN
ncbi:hypothetical protein ACJ8MP_04180 [Bifidobacterium longum subsp. longum]|uniref:hypothetical protein n=1 Tax=Bifidobacterium longum TaxID=216816 RepID=UPI003B9C36B9